MTSSPAPPIKVIVGAVLYLSPPSVTVIESTLPVFLFKVVSKVASVIGDPPETVAVGAIEYVDPGFVKVTDPTGKPIVVDAAAPVPVVSADCGVIVTEGADV